MKRNYVFAGKPSMVFLLAIMLVFVLMFVTSCETTDKTEASPSYLFPIGRLFIKNVTIDELLGMVPGGPFKRYSDALEAAKKIYPNAQGVIYYKTRGETISSEEWEEGWINVGYYAVTFKLIDEVGIKK